jgi:hypothetical protein
MRIIDIDNIERRSILRNYIRTYAQPFALGCVSFVLN